MIRARFGAHISRGAAEAAVIESIPKGTATSHENTWDSKFRAMETEKRCPRWCVRRCPSHRADTSDRLLESPQRSPNDTRLRLVQSCVVLTGQLRTAWASLNRLW